MERPLTAWLLSGAQSGDAGGSNVWTGSHTTTNTTARNTSRPPDPASQGVMSMRSDGCGAQPRGDGASPTSVPGSSATAHLPERRRDDLGDAQGLALPARLGVARHRPRDVEHLDDARDDDHRPEDPARD